MTIRMLIWSYWPGSEGGAERQCRLLSHGLAGQGAAVEVITSRSRWRLPGRERDGLVTIIRLGFLCPVETGLKRALERGKARLVPAAAGSAPRVERMWRLASFWLMLPVTWLARLSFLIEASHLPPPAKGSPAVLHVHQASWLAGLGVRLARRWRIPVVCKESSFPSLPVIGYDTPLRALWSRLRTSADFVCMTDAIRDSFLSQGIPADRLHLMPNGVRIPPDPAAVATNPAVVCVANFYQGMETKSFDILLDAWSRVVRECPAARLVIVGGGDRTAWEHHARALGCLESITFTGRLADPSDIYRQSGVFVLPSRVEGMSNALLEAQAWGLACVVSDIPGNRAVVEDRVNGLVVPVGNASALAAGLSSLLGDPALRTRLGRSARDTAMSRFAIDRVVATALDLYARLAGRPA